MLVYRDASRRVTRAELQRELSERVARCPENPAAIAREERGALLSLLFVAGEIETALDDLHDASAPTLRGDASAPSLREDASASTARGDAHARATIRASSDACAAAWWSGLSWDRTRWARDLPALALPDELVLKRPEGFAYYALDPTPWASAADLAPRGERVLVVGIRSIGTTLGALVCAGLRARGIAAERLTVRPRGHPWDRTHSPAEAELARLRASASAECWIVDEGPGASGSTFLAVAEGIERAGVPLDRITLFTSHAVDADRLVAPDARRRWQRFRVRVVEGGSLFDGALDLGAGRWRSHVYRSVEEWPGAWASTERRKFRLPGSLDLWKFAGLGPYADAPLARAAELARAGFGPRVEPAVSGYLRQHWVRGEPLGRPIVRGSRAVTAPDAAIRRGLVPRLSDYLAFRARAFAAPAVGVAALEEMARVNVSEALGLELPASFRLELAHPVYPDARLAPHEWVATPRGELVKVDAIDHGDDHFFPGPCDTAWDLAGAIIELDLCEADAAALLDGYRARVGDDARARLPGYLVAYAAARVGFLHMAASACEAEERHRLLRDAAAYHERLGHLLGAPRSDRKGPIS